MRVLLIGGNGFIGSHLIDCLLENKHSVRVFDNRHESYRNPNSFVDYRISNTDNYESILLDAINDIDVVFHLASSIIPSSSIINLKEDIVNNVFPTLLILDNMVKLGIKKIVYFSSGGAIYGNINRLPIKEDIDLNPVSLYGLTKLTIENYINYYSKLYEIDALIIRPSNPYGPRQGIFKSQGVISTFLLKAVMNENLEIFGDGSNFKDYMYIDDLVNCVYKLFISSKKGTYNIGSGKGESLNELALLVNEVSEKTNKIVYKPKNKYDVKDFVLDISKLEESIGKNNFTELKEGMHYTGQWILENLDLINSTFSRSLIKN